MKNLIMRKAGEASWIRWIKKRIDNNMNFLAILEGPTGIGKSWTGLRIAYEIDSEFNAREQVAFDFKTMMRIINKFNDTEHELNKKKYKVLLFDESQTSVNKRDWQSKINKLFLYLLSTFRHQNIIVLFTSPYSDFMDSASMKLIHARFECRGWNKKTRKSHVRPKILQYNSKLQRFYEHSLYVFDHGVRAQKLMHWFIDAPPQHIVDPYEDYKTAFTANLNKLITRELEAFDETGIEDKPKGELNPESMQPELWDEAIKGYRTQEELRDRLSKRLGRDIALAHLSQNILFMRRKGYDIRKYKVIEGVS